MKNKQFVINIFSNGILFLLSTIIGLWMTPFLINQLGIEVYGMIPLSNQIINYFSLLTLVLTGAVGRFLSIELVKHDYEKANKIFNTTLFASLFLSIIILPFICVLIFFIPQLLNIPAGHGVETQFLFVIIFISFLLTFVQTCFLVSSWALNRFDLRNSAIIIGKILQVVIMVLLFQNGKANVWLYGISLLVSNLVTFYIHYLIWKKITPELIISKKLYSFKFIHELVNMGKWIIVDQIGGLLLLNIDLVLVNQLLGPTAGGEYGSLLIIPSTIRVFVSTLVGVISPIQMKNYAFDEKDKLISITKITIRTIGFISAISVGIICGFSKQILATWLGLDFIHLWKLLILLILPIIFTLPFQPLFQLQVAYKTVKWPGIVTLFAGFLNIMLSILLVNEFHMGVEGIAISCGLTYCLRTTIFTPLYGEKIQEVKLGTYIEQILPGIAFSIIVLILSFGMVQLLSPSNRNNLLFAILSVGLASCIIGFVLFFRNETKYITHLLLDR